MSKKTGLRIFSYVVFLFSIFVFPWWFSLIIAVICMFYFPNYYEALFFAALMDGIYAAPITRFYEFNFIALATTAILIFAVELLKRRLSFYRV